MLNIGQRHKITIKYKKKNNINIVVNSFISLLLSKASSRTIR
jgi:hypothetical protein